MELGIPTYTQTLPVTEVVSKQECIDFVSKTLFWNKVFMILLVIMIIYTFYNIWKNGGFRKEKELFSKLDEELHSEEDNPDVNSEGELRTENGR